MKGRVRVNVASNENGIAANAKARKKDGSCAKPSFRRAPNVREPGGRLWLALLLLACCAVPAVLAYRHAPDNDLWFLLANGREIMENGFPQDNPFSFIDGQGIVIQQWIPSVIAYLIYSAGGIQAVSLLTLVLSLALIASLWLLAWRILRIRCDVAALAVFVCVCLMSSYLSVRPHVWTMLLFVASLAALEAYRRSGKARALLALPIVALAQANVQSSMLALPIALAVCYALPWDRLLPRRARRLCSPSSLEYRRMPIAAAAVAMLAASLANPYGAAGALYLLSSYGAADYDGYIVEMAPASLDDWYGVWLVAAIALSALAAGASLARRSADPVSIASASVLCLQAMSHTRSVWFAALMLLPLVASALSALSFDDTKAMRGRHARGVGPASSVAGSDVGVVGALLHDTSVKRWCAAATLAFTVVAGAFFVQGSEISAQARGPADSTYTPVVAADAICADASENGRDIADVSVFCHFNAGGYLEWRGLRVGMDARPELWQPSITGIDEDMYCEYVDMCRGRLPVGEYLEGKCFDYLVCDDGSKIETYLASHPEEYSKIADGDGYGVYRAGGGSVSVSSSSSRS